MLGRIRRSKQKQSKQDAPSINGVESLIGGSGVSLDGQSLRLPDDSLFGDADDLSSIATSNYGGGGGGGGPANMSIATSTYGSPTYASPPTIDTKGESAGGEPVQEPVVPPIADTGVATAVETDGDDGYVDKAGGGGFCDSSPGWLKFILVLAGLLLIAAAALVAVGLTQRNGGNVGSTDSSFAGDNPAGDVSTTKPPPGPPPTLAPVNETPVNEKTSVPADPPPTPAPTITPAPTADGDTPNPTDTPVASPTAVPTDTIVASTILPSIEESTLPPEDTEPSTKVVTFYATAGRFQGDDLLDLQENLPSLPTLDGEAFMIHLGDWNSPFATNCDPDSYGIVDQLFSTSAVPVYFIPGDNEYNDCPDPDTALDLWYETLLGYETKYWTNSPYNVTRQAPDYPENFAFLTEGILFVGINLVGGTVHDEEEWAQRQEADLRWINANFEKYKWQTDLLVVFAHADPDIQSSEPFYDGFINQVENDYNVPTILIHRNLGIESSGFEPNFRGVDGLIVLVVEGSVWPPMKVELNAAGLFTFDQSTWFDDQGGRA